MNGNIVQRRPEEGRKPQFLIAAPTSGSGKTTVSRGLMALLVRKGLAVQPFKCGPDYIDTKYHTAVCGRPSVNLDSFMASASHVRRIYARYAAGADACIVEGMMGMYDGYDRDRGSSAEIARLLGLPVVLVVDAKSAAYSMAPLLAGFIGFRPDVRIAGVIFNRVGSARHYGMLQEVCADLGVTCFGYLPKQAELEQSSRYLGLDFSRSRGTDAIGLLADLLEEHVDCNRLLAETDFPLPQAMGQEEATAQGNLRICVACSDEAFSFIYQEHLDILRRMGRVTFFDPEQNLPLPADTDLLYLPGGYPEKRAHELAQADVAAASVRRYAEEGGRVLAECGGMIYLSEGIWQDGDGVSFEARFDPMTGLFPFAISNRKLHRRLSLGYRRFGYQGQQLAGHEFHYTQFVADDARPLPASVASVCNARGEAVNTPVFRYKNTIASYTHLYWGETGILNLF